MSQKIHSQDSNFEFTVVFDKEKETELQKIKRWINKQKPPFNTILTYLFSYVEQWYWDGKVKKTMAEVDQQVKYIGEIWDKEDERSTNKAEVVEEGLFGTEGWSISISNPVVERRSEESNPSMGAGGDEKRLGNPFPDPWDGDWNDGVYTWARLNKLNDK